MRSRVTVALAPLALLAATAACSGDDDGGGGAGLFGGGAGGDGLASIAGGLAALPESAEDQEQETVAWGDLARAAEIAGVERPSDPTDEDAVRDYVLAVTGEPERAGAFALPPEAAHADRPDTAGFAEEVGWSILDVDRFVERQTPPAVVTVLEGDFDEGRLTEALGEPEDGTWTAGDGEPFEQDLQDITPARPLGETLWLAQAGDTLTVARSPDDSAAAGRALAGGDGTATLADDPALAGLAAALDAESPYAALLARPGPTGPAGRAVSREAVEAACRQALPEPTAAVGTAVADDDGPVVLVGLAHASPDAAEANADALERLVEGGESLVTNQPWRELVRLDGVEVSGEGPSEGLVVVARLRPEEPARGLLWYQLLVQRESLVTSC